MDRFGAGLPDLGDAYCHRPCLRPRVRPQSELLGIVPSRVWHDDDEPGSQILATSVESRLLYRLRTWLPFHCGCWASILDLQEEKMDGDGSRAERRECW